MVVEVDDAGFGSGLKPEKLCHWVVVGLRRGVEGNEEEDGDEEEGRWGFGKRRRHCSRMVFYGFGVSERKYVLCSRGREELYESRVSCT